MINLGPNVWGPYGWKFLHFVTFGYPENPSNQDKLNYKNFFYSLGNVIPCPTCAQHYKQHLNMYPLTDNILSNKKNVINWLIDVHNEVNKSLNKRTYTYEEGINLILSNFNKREGFENVTNFFNKHQYLIIAVFILLIFVGLKLRNKYLKE
jgi:hypothetical protein